MITELDKLKIGNTFKWRFIGATDWDGPYLVIQPKNSFLLSEEFQKLPDETVLTVELKKNTLEYFWKNCDSIEVFVTN